MTDKTVIPTEPALRDVREAVLNYRDTASERVVSNFLAALEEAYRFVGANPAAGSPRYANLVDLPDIRGWSLRRFPYIVFYVEREARIEVVRVLHGHRDIAASLRQPSNDQ
jgi:toxin ParE1/3/4